MMEPMGARLTSASLAEGEGEGGGLEEAEVRATGAKAQSCTACDASSDADGFVDGVAACRADAGAGGTCGANASESDARRGAAAA